MNSRSVGACSTIGWRHDRDGVGDPAGGGEVVGDEQDGGAGVAAAAQQVEGVVGQRPVEAGGGFVGEQQRRVRGEGEGGDQALGHAAGEFVGVTVEVGGVETDIGGEPVGGGGRGGAGVPVRAQGLDQLPSTGTHPGQRGGGALRDQADDPATYLPGEVPFAAAEQVDRAGGGAAGLPGGGGVTG